MSPKTSLELQKNLKITEDKFRVNPGSETARSMALSFKLLQIITLGHETYKVQKNVNVHKVAQTDPEPGKQCLLDLIFAILFSMLN